MTRDNSWPLLNLLVRADVKKSLEFKTSHCLTGVLSTSLSSKQRISWNIIKVWKIYIAHMHWFHHVDFIWSMQMMSRSPWNSKCHCTAQMRWYYERILSELSVPTPEAGWLRWLFFAPIPNILTTHAPEAGAFVWSHAQTHQNHHNVPSSVTTLSTFCPLCYIQAL